MEESFKFSLKNEYQYDIAALLVCIVTLIFALVVGHFHEIGNINSVETDFYGAYAPQAKNIIKGLPYTYQHNPPGYTLLLALLSFLTGDLFIAAKIINAFATAILGVILYFLFKRLFDPRIALASTILSMIALIQHSFIAATDILGALLIMLPLWVLLKNPQHPFRLCIFSGIFSGIAYCVRYNTVFVIIGIIFSILIINPINQSIKMRLQCVALFVCAVILTISPWLIMNWQTNGSPFTSTAYLQIAAHFYHPAGDVFPMRDAFNFSSLSDVILYDPLVLIGKYMKDILLKNPKRLITYGLKFPAYLFVGAGFLLLLRELSRQKLTLLLTCFLGYLLLGLVGFHFRYYFFLWPILFLFVNCFFFHQHIFNALGKLPLLKLSISWLIVLVLIILMAMNSFIKIRRTFDSEPRYVFEIADLLKKRSSPHDIIISLKSHYSYYAGLDKKFPMAQNPDDYLKESAGDYLAKAKEIGARYIIYSDHEASHWLSLKTLADPDKVPKELKLIYRHKPTNTLVYEIDYGAADETLNSKAS